MGLDPDHSYVTMYESVHSVYNAAHSYYYRSPHTFTCTYMYNTLYNTYIFVCIAGHIDFYTYMYVLVEFLYFLTEELNLVYGLAITLLLYNVSLQVL